MEEGNISSKSRLVALLLCAFFGVFGVHRFYVGKIGTAILMICTLGGFGIWATLDFILILSGAFTDKKRKRIYKWLEAGSI